MGDKPNKTEAAAAPDNQAAPAASRLTAADAAKRVKGKVRLPIMRGGKPVINNGVYETVEREVSGVHVLAFAERDGKVTVVTVDGQKLHEAA